MNEIGLAVDKNFELSSDWSEFRRQMPVTTRWAYFDHAAVAPLPKPAAEAIQRWSQAAMSQGDVDWPKWERRIEQVRKLAAKMVNAEEQEVALVPNTTTGISYVAEGLDWTAGDNVVMSGGEFPSNVFPWMNLRSRGVEIRVVNSSVEANSDGEHSAGKIDLNRLADACDRRTRLITLSWVGFASGYRVDPAEAARMAHDHGALFFLDAIQGLGVFPLDVRATDIDFFGADGHKWMLGPEGAGLLYIKQQHLDCLRPQCVGWNSVVRRHDFSEKEMELRPEAARYEGGSQNMVGYHGLGESLELLRKFGLASNHSLIANRVLQVTGQLCQRLLEIGATIISSQENKTRSGIVSFQIPGQSPDQLRRHLLELGVVLSVRNGALRASAHAYNNQTDIEKLAEGISDFMRKKTASPS